jgi:hypothetical protein
LLEVMMVDDGAVRRQLRFDADRVRRLTRVEPTVISIHSELRPTRRRVEAYLESAYARAFDGRIARHYPTLMSVEDASGEIHAAVGFRFATAEPLFLEQYLDEPVEAAIGRAQGVAVERARVVEIGNLASDSQGASLFLFLALADYLHRQGGSHAVATATRQLRRSFARVGFPTSTLTRAEPERLSGGAADWGGYYERDPEVLVGPIANALPTLATMLSADPIAEASVRTRLHPAPGRRVVS